MMVKNLLNNSGKYDILFIRNTERCVLMYTYGAIVSELKKNGIDSPQLEARELLYAFCGVERAEILTHLEREYDSPELDLAVQKRCSRIPLQYIIGRCGFRGGIFKVTEDTLIPRADTEMLVEFAAERLPKGAKILDLCTGSGCIAISILSERPDTSAIATDICEGALNVAAENARENCVADRASFLWDDALAPSSIIPHAPFDAIISNPPYIPTDVIEGLSPEVKNEPIAALDGGPDGLIFYRYVTEKYREFLATDGFILYEIGYDQEDAIKEIASEFGFDCTVFRDVGQNPRMAYLRKKGEEK